VSPPWDRGRTLAGRFTSTGGRYLAGKKRLTKPRQGKARTVLRGPRENACKSIRELVEERHEKHDFVPARYIPFVRMVRFVRMSDPEFLGDTTISGGWKIQFIAAAREILSKGSKKEFKIGDKLIYYKDRDGRIILERAK
jgi:hypothetical protein